MIFFSASEFDGRNNHKNNIENPEYDKHRKSYENHNEDERNKTINHK